MSKDSPKKPETQLDQDSKEEMPSPLPNPSGDGTVIVNGGEPSVFGEPHAGARQNIPEHIKPDELPKDELRTLVRQQLEYYFSRFVLYLITGNEFYTPFSKLLTICDTTLCFLETFNLECLSVLIHTLKNLLLKINVL